MSDYELEIVSQGKKDKGKVFKVFDVEEEGVVGVQKNEPFMLRFRNLTNERVQVRLSLDGTDILTGEVASTKPKGKMWIVEANDYLELSAWPETSEAGARFVFTDEAKGVSVNTHGNTVGQGLIGAAVYKEYLVSSGWGFSTSPNIPGGSWGTPGLYTLTGTTGISDSTRFSGGNKGSSTIPISAGGTSGSIIGSTDITTQSFNAVGASSDSDSVNYSSTSINVIDRSTRIGEVNDGVATMDRSVEKLAVGAGEQVSQQIETTTGLSNPVLDEIVQLRYLPWVQLKKLIAVPKRSSAFPGDGPQKGINLKSVPRVRSSAKRKQKRSPLQERFA